MLWTGDSGPTTKSISMSTRPPTLAARRNDSRNPWRRSTSSTRVCSSAMISAAGAIDKISRIPATINLAGTHKKITENSTTIPGSM